MRQTIGIRFSKFGQTFVCLYECEEKPIEVGNIALVNTDHGLNSGVVIWQRPWRASEEYIFKKSNACIALTGKLNLGDPNNEQEELVPEFTSPIPFATLATEEQCRIHINNVRITAEAFHFCRKCINFRQLEMKLIDVELLFDKTKIIFYFTAPTRIDFRELIKDLVREYRTRIELRQIGVRHETQMLGALGNCGMVCCCKRYLHSFAPVTIKMAKEQNLFLNPSKISGSCGRLLCCLSFEHDCSDSLDYCDLVIDKQYNTEKGVFKLINVDTETMTLTVLHSSGEQLKFSEEEWFALLSKTNRSDSL